MCYLYLGKVKIETLLILENITSKLKITSLVVEILIELKNLVCIHFKILNMPSFYGSFLSITFVDNRPTGSFSTICDLNILKSKSAKEKVHK